uniref:Secreted protein n=1 Tax=Caenorhabditis tropicalis TaxID=1561998 RepID=A0A1I7U6C9_9PELO
MILRFSVFILLFSTCLILSARIDLQNTGGDDSEEEELDEQFTDKNQNQYASTQENVRSTETIASPVRILKEKKKRCAAAAAISQIKNQVYLC